MDPRTASLYKAINCDILSVAASSLGFLAFFCRAAGAFGRLFEAFALTNFLCKLIFLG